MGEQAQVPEAEGGPADSADDRERRQPDRQAVHTLERPEHERRHRQCAAQRRHGQDPPLVDVPDVPDVPD